MLRVLLWSSDPVGERMAGPGIRYHRLAGELARRFEVTLVAPGGGLPEPLPYVFRPDGTIGGAADVEADVVVAQRLPLRLARGLKRRGVRLVYDLYVPAIVEASAQLAGEPGDTREAALRYEEVIRHHDAALRLGDAFVCASERQRDLWLGALGLVGRCGPAAYAADPGLRSLVTVVPFGLDVAPPTAGGGLKSGAVPGIGTGDRVLLWGGGIWNWLDPLTVIRAHARVAERREDVKLVFLGTRHPSSAVEAMSMGERARALAAELRLLGKGVVFMDGWVPFAERLACFADADLGVSAHPETAEARFAFRTRLLDHVAVGTPLVVTEGDVLADLVESRGLGRVVAPGDAAGWATAVLELLEHPDAYAKARAAVAASREELTWERAARPLADLLDGAPAPAGAGSDAAIARAELTRVRSSLARRGVLGTLRALRR